MFASLSSQRFPRRVQLRIDKQWLREHVCKYVVATTLVALVKAMMSIETRCSVSISTNSHTCVDLCAYDISPQKEVTATVGPFSFGSCHTNRSIFFRSACSCTGFAPAPAALPGAAAALPGAPPPLGRIPAVGCGSRRFIAAADNHGEKLGAPPARLAGF